MPKVTDKQLIEFFETNQGELNQERSDFLLPQIVDFVDEKSWINTSPEYQRRQVWDIKKKSRLIESLLMNVPVPPIYLYEKDYSRYEVMDGQQRLNSIIEFYKNRFRLKSLSSWTMFNGKKYDDLPQKVQRGLDRRRISATVIISDLSNKPYSSDDVRRQVFDRLNTGGMQLNAQELRNCLYPGRFNKLLIDLSGEVSFTEVFGIPPHNENITAGGRVSENLLNDTYYKRMYDCELVLRFFTYRRSGSFRSSIPKALDNCMIDLQDISQEEYEKLKNIFLTRLNLAIEIFSDDTFFLPNKQKSKRPSIPLYDSMMIAIDRLYEYRDSLVENRERIKLSLSDLLEDDDVYDTIIGKPGTAKAIKKRVELIQQMLEDSMV